MGGDPLRRINFPTSWANCFDLSAVEPATTVAELKGHTIDISQLAVTHDGDSFVSAARDGTVRFWDLKAWPPQSKRIFHAHDAVISLALHDEGRWMATAGADGVARLWDLSRPESSDARHVLDSHDDYSFSSTAVSQTGRWIATTVRGNRFQLWDVESDNPSTFCRVLENPTSAFSELAISANDRWLVASCHDGSLQVWDLAASDLPSSRKILPAPQDLELVEGDGGARLAVGPNGRWVAVSYGSHSVAYRAVTKGSWTRVDRRRTLAVRIGIGRMSGSLRAE